MPTSTGSYERNPHEVSPAMTHDRQTCRRSTPCHHQTLAEALHCLTQHGDLTLNEVVGKLAERDIHVRAKQLYDWSNCYQVDERMAMPFRVFAALVDITRCPLVLEFLARRIGYRMEPLGVRQSARSRAAQVQDEAMELVASIGVLVANVRAAMADGACDETDAMHLRGPLRDAKQRLAELERAIEAPDGMRVA